MTLTVGLLYMDILVPGPHANLSDNGLNSVQYTANKLCNR
jgi:hypothetical protein